MKLIAIDLDGTLLSSQLKISDVNRKAILKAQEKHHVMICSGRAPEDIQAVLKEFDLQCDLAGSNGTVVYSKGKLLSRVSISEGAVRESAALLDQKNVPYKIYTSEGIYVLNSWAERTTAALKAMDGRHSISESEYKRITEQPKADGAVKLFDSVEDLLSMEGLSIQKFFILTLDQGLKEELLPALESIDGIAPTSSGPNNIEIMNPDGHKGQGLRIMASHLGIKMEDTVAIGDNFNDVPMMEAAGLSIAMGNADPDVKKLCDRETVSNNDDGVAHAIMNVIMA
ncbi:HAD family phosphatase [Metabacillus sp. KIGAM252]|uniref:HAD family phosphatase n=1 Tax=Metabacillus flavus TaxID=2823519 RepID=A0ABS5LFR1_9BACI|nr:Cof-type HAD-IIB family hydrolase [Metabacillus flavus]MBS2969229.1 HAD family phosphatase [Metabacillus flavus]